MADSSLSVDTAVALATLRAAAAKFLWKSGDDSPHLGRLMEWKDWVDEVLLALQQGGVDPTVLFAPGTLGVSGSAQAVDDADFAASAGWDAVDDTIDQDSAEGTIALYSFAITPGGSVVAAPQTVTLTFPTELAAAPKMAIAMKVDNDANSTVTGWAIEALNTTVCTLQTIGNPVDAVTETCRVLLVF